MARRVLGVDPGSSATGWALVVAEGNRYRLEAAGVVRPKGGDRVARLANLERRFAELLEGLRPDCAAVESSFSGRNPRSGLALAESRGVILAALGRAGVATSSYSPAEIKSAIVGHGRAETADRVHGDAPARPRRRAGRRATRSPSPHPPHSAGGCRSLTPKRLVLACAP
jgi:crossover junction endodeoxyribonuclease RuvC